MSFPPPPPSRRSFLATSASLGALTLGRPLLAQTPPPVTANPLSPADAKSLTNPATISVLGPRPGFTPQVGTLASQLTWMQHALPGPRSKFTVEDLDYLLDKNANSIGALLLHLAATETYYGRHTFLGETWGKFPADVSAKWDPAMELGDSGRKSIRGHDLAFYTSTLAEVRAHTLAELAKRDDAWLMTVDSSWPWGPTNNSCKWFHVCEHISHHAGQIDLLAKRLPSYKPAPEGV